LGQVEGHRDWWNGEIANVRISGTKGEQPLERFERDEGAGALKALTSKPLYLAEQEFKRRSARDCCVQVKGNELVLRAGGLGAPERDGADPPSQGGDPAERPDRGAPHEAGGEPVLAPGDPRDLAGLVLQRANEQASQGDLAEAVPMDLVRRSTLERTLSGYAALVAKVGW
jgi:hypothetical protein